MSRKVFEEARQEGRREAHEAYMADALVALCNPVALSPVSRANGMADRSGESASTPPGAAAVPDNGTVAGNS
jgi:hypothetical protein